MCLDQRYALTGYGAARVARLIDVLDQHDVQIMQSLGRPHQRPDDLCLHRRHLVPLVRQMRLDDGVGAVGPAGRVRVRRTNCRRLGVGRTHIHPPRRGVLSHQNRSIWWLLGQCVVVCLKLRGWDPWPLARR